MECWQDKCSHITYGITTTFGSVIKIVNLCFDVVPPRVDGQYFAMGDVAISLINITHLRDALSKGQVINEAETP